MPTLRPLPAILLLAACAKPLPPPPEFAAAPTADTILVPVVTVAQAAPLSDGRWVLLAPVEGKVEIADFAAKTATPFPGITAKAVPGPTSFFPLGDTIVVSDWGLRRFSAWVVGATQPLAAWPAPDALRGAYPQARDAAGRWYFALAPNPGTDGSGLRDSTVIVRSDPELTRFDTLARLAPPSVAQSPTEGGQWVREALGGEDAWGVRPDGTLWIARVFQNRMEWHPAGGQQVVRWPPLPDPTRLVSQMDRQLYIRRFPEAQQQTVAQHPFAAVKPPFERVFVRPDGRVWLFKSDTALAPVRRFQVADSTGVRYYVTVPSRGTALALDDRYILMGEEFPGGIRLLRYAVPADSTRQSPP